MPRPFLLDIRFTLSFHNHSFCDRALATIASIIFVETKAVENRS
jgi:hypothetical protein